MGQECCGNNESCKSQVRQSFREVQLRDTEEKLIESLHNVRNDLGKKNVDWEERYLEATRDAVRWAKRYEDLEDIYKNKIDKLKEEFQTSLEEGYEEAYHILIEEKKRAEELEKQLNILQDENVRLENEIKESEKVAYKGYEQAYGIIEDLQGRLKAQLAKEESDLKEAMELYQKDFTDADGEVGGK